MNTDNTVHRRFTYKVYEKRLTKFTFLSYIAGMAVTVILAMLVISRVNVYYQNQIAELNTQLVTFEEQKDAEIQAVRDDYDVIIEVLENDINELNTTISNLESQYSTLTTERDAAYSVINDYWYVFKSAGDNSGITLDVILYMEEQCKRWNVSPDLMWHIIEIESGYTAKIDNSRGSGARGLGQVMPATGKSYWENILGYGSGTYTHEMAYDPYVNIEIICALMGRNLANDSLYNAIQLYSGGGGQSYYNKVINAASAHGITINEDTCRYTN